MEAGSQGPTAQGALEQCGKPGVDRLLWHHLVRRSTYGWGQQGRWQVVSDGHWHSWDAGFNQEPWMLDLIENRQAAVSDAVGRNTGTH